MPKEYYNSELTAAQIDAALNAIDGVIIPGNNGKVLAISDGKIVARSASDWGHGAILEPLNATANGDYYPPSGTDGFDSVHVAVPSATLTTKSITQNGTYNASQDNADGYSSVTVNVSGGGSAVVQSLSVTQNGTYNPPSGVDGYAPVTVNVSGGGLSASIGELFHHIMFSNVVGDKVQRAERYFVRTTNEPIIFLAMAVVQNGAFTYTGYGAISFLSSGISGNYSENGNLTEITQQVTPNGTTYYTQRMTGPYQVSVESGRVLYFLGGNYCEIRQVPNMSYLYIDRASMSIAGNQPLINALNSYIDAMYQEYYAS